MAGGGYVPDLTPLFYLAFAGVGGAVGLAIAAGLLAFGANPWAALAAVPVGAGVFALLGWWKA